jgi:hypothetical protein
LQEFRSVQLKTFVKASLTEIMEAGISVLGAKLGGGGQVSSGDISVSRLKFVVPIVPPVQVVHGGDVKPVGKIKMFE